MLNVQRFKARIHREGLYYVLAEQNENICRPALLGTLSKDDDNGCESIGKKMNLRSFKLNLVYLDMSNGGDFSWSWILKDFIQVQKE